MISVSIACVCAQEMPHLFPSFYKSITVNKCDIKIIMCKRCRLDTCNTTDFKDKSAVSTSD